MTRLLTIIFLITITTSCFFEAKVETRKVYQKYFEDDTWKIFQTALKSVENRDYKQTIVLLTKVIEKSKHNLNNHMPLEINPYYYRAHANYSIGKYDQSLIDFDKVISDTTTNVSIYIESADIYRMLKKPEKALENCNLVLTKLDKNNALAYYVRGLTKLSIKDTIASCKDFSLSEKAGFDQRAFADFRNICK